MKSILLVTFYFLSISCDSQVTNFTFPKITNHANKWIDIVPSGWKLVDSVYCDFDKDSLTDLVMVISTCVPIQPKDTDCISSEPFYPKMLIIMFRKPDNTFELSISATRFFGDCNWGIQGQDPYNKIFSRRNTLGIQFSTGGTLRNLISYFFQYRDNNWYLVGASTEQYQQGQSGFYIEDINFVKRTKESYSKNSLQGKRLFLKKTVLDDRALIKLRDFTDDSQIPFTPEN